MIAKLLCSLAQVSGGVPLMVWQREGRDVSEDVLDETASTKSREDAGEWDGGASAQEGDEGGGGGDALGSREGSDEDVEG